MVTVETMYGVSHGEEVSILGLVTSQFEARPSSGLVRQLRKLPAGTKVGIETLDPAEFTGTSIVIGKNKRGSKKYEIVGSHYWDELLEICKEATFDVAFLDDFATWKAHLEKKHEAQQIFARYQRRARRDERLSRPFDLERETDAKIAAFRALTEAEYIFHIEREEKIIANIVKYSPRVVIVGSGHGDYMIQAPYEMRQKGLEIQNYKREVVDKQMLHWSLLNNYMDPTRTISEEGLPDPQILVYREAVIRQYRAVTEGRITAKGEKPDYIGTWEVACPPRGLFEVFVEGPNFSGRIEDTLGTASFAGQITEAEVLFAKNYYTSKSTDETSTRTLLYQGVFQNGQYDGIFQTHDENESGRFVMSKFQQ